MENKSDIISEISREGFYGGGMDKILKVLMNLIKAVLHKEEMDIEQYRSLLEKEEDQLYKLCSTHSIGVIAGDVLGKTDDIEKTPVVKKLMNQAFMAVIRYEQSESEIGKITRVLTDLKIPYIILKGPRVRKYYPEPWLRTSGDIDILVHEEDVDRAVEGLVKQCSYEKQERNYHDVPMLSPNDVLLELHFNIKENMDNLDRVLIKVWFGDQTHTDVTRAMERYIILGGTFGTKENFAAVGQVKNGGHLRYMFTRIFASYGHLKGRYPSLEQHKYLMPVYQVRRWIDMIKKGKLKKYTAEYKLSQKISREKLDSTEKLLKALKLN